MDIPDELDEYVNDYKIHVFEIAWLTDDQICKIQSDFRIDKRYEKVIQNSKGVSNMCEVAERLENNGRAEGRAEERMELIKTMLLNGKTPQEISDFCKISIEEIEKVQSEMK